MALTEDYRQRFGGLGRLYGDAALEALAQAHMVVVGLGGVGSWAAEALARSGVGEITLIEMDDICITNTNRQAHALTSQVGRSKNKAVAARLRDINPEIRVHCVEDFLDSKNLPTIIGSQHHIVIDAMDAAITKSALVAYCSACKIRLVTVGSSGGKSDPTRIRVDDLGRTEGDPLLAKIRVQMYRKHGFARNGQRKFRVDAVFSPEQMVYPKPDGSVCMEKQVMQDGVRLDCTGGFGSSVMVTGAFGFAAAARAVERYLQKAIGRELP
ncbi:MAG: tRNA cyclic N6-threonylcarbamoyladenosine(37) synthase TcdA [Cellvibrionaceae bacterium]|nr:tRNA cyclic N6-threonylcarbamoyladenosine(37) synthase TcdA [Cellvibrionaceae bacterium]